MDKVEKKTYRKLLILFFLSGATALVYEVVWTRLLTLSFGSTILAVSTVLTAFMGGLAVGSAFMGKRADAVERPARFYAWLELLIGVYTLATPQIFSWMESLYVSLNATMTFGFWQSAVLRFVLAVIVLLPPTILMGGTLPVLSKLFVNERSDNTGKALSALYFFNTAGAVIGTVAAGVLLIELLGIHRLLMVCAMVNVGIFLLAYWTPVRLELASPVEEDLIPEPRWSKNALLAATALFFSGLAALTYEVAWTRVLTLILGSSTYAFTVMLATFLTGIALGSAMIGKFADNRKQGLILLGFCQVMIGVLALATASLFGTLPDVFIFLFGKLGKDYTLFLLANFLICFLVMAPATVFMGASFPVAAALVVETFGGSGQRIGLLYAFNTVGAIIGSFLAGFVLMPSIGIHTTIVLAIFANLLIGLVLSTISISERISKSGCVIALLAGSLIAVLGLVWKPAWDIRKMTSGPYAHAGRAYHKVFIEEWMSPRWEQLYYREGPTATVSVARKGGLLNLFVDGKVDASTHPVDMTTQLLLGHLPLYIKPDAKDVLVIGFASGITAGAAAQHEVRQIDSVEIEPAMKEASRFFDKENYHILNDSRFRLIIDDARSYALVTKKKYDVVISEPSNPWQAGSSRLFTREAFLRARRILREDGLMVQWMHINEVDLDTFRLVLRTFMSVFPHATLWIDPKETDAIFVGALESKPLYPLSIEKMFNDNVGVRNSLARIGYGEDWSLLKAYFLGEEELKQFAGTGDINTDDLPLLEYRAPRSLYSFSEHEIVKTLLSAKSPESFPKIFIKSGEEPKVVVLLKKWGESLARVNKFNARGAFLNASLLSPSDYQAHFQLGHLRLQTQDPSGALESFEKALSLRPEMNSKVYEYIGTAHYQMGNFDKAHTFLQKAISLGNDSAVLRNNLSVVLAKMGRVREAAVEARKALSYDPDNLAAKKNLKNYRNLLKTENDMK